MTNLLQETLKKLKLNDKKECDVLWVGDGKDLEISWEEFKEIADIEYDSGYGAVEIASDLVVVGKDFWIERHEYDGSEWWEFKEIPIRALIPKKFKKVTNQKNKYYLYLKDMQGE